MITDIATDFQTLCFSLQRRLFVSGLERLADDGLLELRRAQLERDFRKYAGDLGVEAIVPKNQTYAFVTLASERQADLAMQEMQSKYRLNRARQTRLEVLEERAAAKEANDGTAKETSDWD